MGKNRMQEPWGYQDNTRYQGGSSLLDNMVERAGSELMKEIMDKVNALFDKINAEKADKDHKHTIDDVTDVEKDASGVVLGREFMKSTVILNAGQF